MLECRTTPSDPAFAAARADRGDGADDPPLLFRWRQRAHRVRYADGPERIAAEWWRQASKTGSGPSAPEARDYYRVEDEEGQRFWLYRDGLYRPDIAPRWFLHGFFG